MIIFIIFFIGLFLRFLYFPNDIYFGYDQARDFYSSLSLLQGDLKIVGPPSSFSEQIFHGPLIYYIYAPFLWLSPDNIEAVSLFLRLLNNLGIFLTFALGTVIFNRRIGILVAFFFAVSLEQTQYALFLGHPAQAVIPVLSYFLGLSLLVFKKEIKGLILAALSLGLTIQFHYVHTLLLFGLVTLLVLFRQQVKNCLSLKNIILAVFVFLLSISTFLISEIKYGFRLSRAGIETINKIGIGEGGSIWENLGHGWQMSQRLIKHNFGDNTEISLIITAVFLGLIIWLYRDAKQRNKGLFLTVWFLSGILPYVLTKSPSYYYGAGASVSLLILAAFLLEKLWMKSRFLVILILVMLGIGNYSLVMGWNNKGPNLDMVIQPQMLLRDEYKVVDYIYQQTKGQPVSVKGLTVPLQVNTTWSYLFQGYGHDRYGYLPMWIGPIAEGYLGNLPVSTSRSDLSQTQFLIIEPTVGIREGMIEQFFEEEGYFTKVVEEEQFGQFKVQKRLRY